MTNLTLVDGVHYFKLFYHGLCISGKKVLLLGNGKWLWVEVVNGLCSLAGEKWGALYLRLEITAILSIIQLIYISLGHKYTPVPTISLSSLRSITPASLT